MSGEVAQAHRLLRFYITKKVAKKTGTICAACLAREWLFSIFRADLAWLLVDIRARRRATPSRASRHARVARFHPPANAHGIAARGGARRRARPPRRPRPRRARAPTPIAIAPRPRASSSSPDAGSRRRSRRSR